MKSKTKELALTGILTAIAIIIPLVVPVSVVSFPLLPRWQLMCHL